MYNIFLKIIQYNIETINYKNKNPQVYLMGSNPTPRASNGGSNSSNINNFYKDPIINQDKVEGRRKSLYIKKNNNTTTINIIIIISSDRIRKKER